MLTEASSKYIRLETRLLAVCLERVSQHILLHLNVVLTCDAQLLQAREVGSYEVQGLAPG